MGWFTKFLGFKEKKKIPTAKPSAQPSQPSVQPSKPSLSKVSKGSPTRKKPSKPSSAKVSEGVSTTKKPSKATKTKVPNVREDKRLVTINQQLESRVAFQEKEIASLHTLLSKKDEQMSKLIDQLSRYQETAIMFKSQPSVQPSKEPSEPSSAKVSEGTPTEDMGDKSIKELIIEGLRKGITYEELKRIGKFSLNRAYSFVSEYKDKIVKIGSRPVKLKLKKGKLL